MQGPHGKKSHTRRHNLLCPAQCYKGLQAPSSLLISFFLKVLLSEPGKVSHPQELSWNCSLTPTLLSPTSFYGIGTSDICPGTWLPRIKTTFPSLLCNYKWPRDKILASEIETSFELHILLKGKRYPCPSPLLVPGADDVEIMRRKTESSKTHVWRLTSDTEGSPYQFSVIT